jgi:hypothetical protein
VFYNGDIVLDKYNEKLIFGDDDDDNCSYRRKRAAARTQSKLWPYGILKYKWASNISPDVEPSIMARYNNHGKCTVPTVIEITDTAGYVLPHYIHSRSVT